MVRRELSEVSAIAAPIATYSMTFPTGQRDIKKPHGLLRVHLLPRFYICPPFLRRLRTATMDLIWDFELPQMALEARDLSLIRILPKAQDSFQYTSS